MMYRTHAAMLLLAAFTFATPAAAANCSLTLLTSVDMAPTDFDVMSVPATINGVEKHLLVDTGGISSLSRKTADDLKLKPASNGRVGFSDIGGRVSKEFVWLDSLQLGRLQGKHVSFGIWPNPDSDFDGLIAWDVLSKYDVELNFAARKLNIFSPDHCEGQVVYWPAGKIAVVPFSSTARIQEDPDNPSAFSYSSSSDTHIRVPVTLDGKEFYAIIDTGAFNTTMSAAMAKYAFGIEPDTQGAVPVGNVNGDPREKSFGYVFHSLTFDGVAVSNPRVVIHPDLMRTGPTKDLKDIYARGGQMDRPEDHMTLELVVGMNVLKQLHLYIAYSEKKLYVTQADPAAPETAK